MRERPAVCLLLFGLAALGKPTSVQAAELRDLPALNATRTRPLFSPTRRPPPPAEPPKPVQFAPPVVETVPSPSLQLSGVVVGTNRQVAIVTRLQEKKPIQLEVGSEIDGWTVAEILPRAITLRRAERTITFGLRDH